MTPDGTAPQQVIRMAVEDAFQEGYRAGMNDGHDLSLKTTEAQHRETKDEIVRAALASPGPRREPPPDLLAEAEKCARTIYVATDRDVADHVSGVIVRLVQCIREAHLVDAVGRVPLTETQLAELLYECPGLWTAGDTDPQDREIYALAAKWLLPRLAEVSVPVSPPTEGPPTDMTRDELLDDALGRPVTPPDAPDAPRGLGKLWRLLKWKLLGTPYWYDRSSDGWVVCAKCGMQYGGPTGISHIHPQGGGAPRNVQLTPDWQSCFFDECQFIALGASRPGEPR